MSSPVRHVAVVVAALALVGASALAAPAGAAATAGVGDAVRQDAAQQADDCDFNALYDRAIDSVVTVRVWSERGDRSTGSGWVYDTDGGDALVVTNWHVVQGIIGADVQFSDREWRRVSEVVGVDFYSDLAVLRVENASGVEPLPVTDALPDQGDQVAALGSPLGLSGSITRGIVSAVDRSVTVQNRTIADTVQIDTPIAPGNSGGPLVNCDGEVVGVNFAGAFALDVNFAISASMVRQVVPSLVENGTYDHSYLGIRGTTLSPTMARINDVDVSSGVLVVSTIADGPADDALRGSPSTERVTGIPVGGDVLVAIDGDRVRSLEALQEYLFEETAPGDTVTLTVIRDGERRQVDVTLGAKRFPRERIPST